MNRPSVELTLHFLCIMDHLHLATGASRLVCDAIMGEGLLQSFADEVELAVSEAATNAIRHTADADPSAMVTISLRAYETHLVIEISDRGPGFDFDGVPEPDFDEHPEGGYGLYIIRTMMDEVGYERGNGINTLVMKKQFRKKGEVSL